MNIYLWVIVTVCLYVTVLGHEFMYIDTYMYIYVCVLTCMNVTGVCVCVCLCLYMYPCILLETSGLSNFLSCFVSHQSSQGI